MSESTCIYDQHHVIPVYNRNGLKEDRNLHIRITDCRDCLRIKLRDTSECLFNYTEEIDLSDFELLRAEQTLDINFSEFKTDLIDMLQQYHKKEMFLKCQIQDEICKLVFFGKSKIKCIIFLTLDLHVTSQKEIFNEMNNNLVTIQNVNERLQQQLENARRSISDKESQVNHMLMLRKHLTVEFLNNLKMLDDVFNRKIKMCEEFLTNRILCITHKVNKLLHEVSIIKNEAGLRSDSSARLLKSMENLRLETIENVSLINELKKENSNLLSTKYSQELNIKDLRHRLTEKDAVCTELKEKNEELVKDLEKATIIVSQKTQTNDELAKDLLQANQMLVNFNNHYDMKDKQVSDLQEALTAKERIIKEQRIRSDELLRQFERYRQQYNAEVFEELNNKIQELEKNIIKTNKINGLLTKKISSQNGLFDKNTD